jgi:hypothetical protein
LQRNQCRNIHRESKWNNKLEKKDPQNLNAYQAIAGKSWIVILEILKKLMRYIQVAFFYTSFEIFVCTLLSYFLKYFQFIFEENLTFDFCCRIISLAVWNHLLKNPRILAIATECCIGIEEILISPTSTIVIFHR